MVTIPSGSFFFSKYIENQISSRSVSNDEVLFAMKRGEKQAFEYRMLNVEFKSNEWFYLAKIIGESNPDTAYELANIYYIEGNIDKAIYWYKKAVSLKSNKALQELIDLYIGEGYLEKAKAELLLLKSKQHSLTQLIEVSLALGDIKLVEELAPLINSSKGYKLLKELKKYKVLPYTVINDSVQTSTVKQCSNSVQLFATRLNHLYKLDSLIEKVSNHPLSQFFCFNTPRYISIEQLECKYNPKRAIQCDEALWGEVDPNINTRYIGLMLSRGGANVNNGILYLDFYDDVNVFIHELSHLVGFVDEYALPNKHRVCNQAQEDKFSHNISILPATFKGSKKQVVELLKQQVPWFNLIDKNVPIMEKVGNSWQIGTPLQYVKSNKVNVGLFKSETCDNSNLQAFKPTYIKTNLRYYEEPFTDLYLKLLTQNPNDYLMPSYHYNVAKSFFSKDDEKKGLLWLQKALSHENSMVKGNHKIDRFNKIKLGHY